MQRVLRLCRLFMTSCSTSLENCSKIFNSKDTWYLIVSTRLNWSSIVASVPIVLVGNKTDLYVDRMITTDQGKRLASSWNAAFLETSAKQNEVISSISLIFWLCYLKLISQQMFFHSPLQISFIHYWTKLREPMEIYKKSQIVLFVKLVELIYII